MLTHKRFSGLNLGQGGYIAPDRKVGFNSRCGKRYLKAFLRWQTAAETLGVDRLRLYEVDLILEEIPCLVALKMLRNGYKALAHTLRELLVAYAHDILHIKYLYTQQTDERKRHQYGQYPDCLFFHLL